MTFSLTFLSTSSVLHIIHGLASRLEDCLHNSVQIFNNK